MYVIVVVDINIIAELEVKDRCLFYRKLALYCNDTIICMHVYVSLQLNKWMKLTCLYVTHNSGYFISITQVSVN